MYNFRPRLFMHETEDDLFEYFEKNARYDETLNVYTCAGCVSTTPENLFKRLKIEWENDKYYYETNELPNITKKALLKK